MTQFTTRHIQAYSLLEYTQKLSEALNEGYELKLDTNEGTCQHIGFYFEVLVYKKPDVELKVPESTYGIDTEDVPTLKTVAVQSQKQRGRPSTK